jgi:hypothetical protein
VNNLKSLSEIKDDMLRKLSILAQAKNTLVAWAKNKASLFEYNIFW